jgi:hypothetical protein
MVSRFFVECDEDGEVMDFEINPNEETDIDEKLNLILNKVVQKT